MRWVRPIKCFRLIRTIKILIGFYIKDAISSLLAGKPLYTMDKSYFWGVAQLGSALKTTVPKVVGLICADCRVAIMHQILLMVFNAHPLNRLTFRKLKPDIFLIDQDLNTATGRMNSRIIISVTFHSQERNKDVIRTVQAVEQQQDNEPWTRSTLSFMRKNKETCQVSIGWTH